MTFRGRNVLVVGLAKSGVAAARLLAKRGARVTVADEKSRHSLAPALKRLPASVRVRAAARRLLDRRYDLIVVSPGVPWDHPELARARKAGTPVWPELELGWRFVRPAATIAVTGTNGKTTTTALIGEIIRAAGRPVVVAGNIGDPLSAVAHRVTEKTVLVLEVSSYQLEGHETFHPNVGVFLNLTPDHLKRHGTMAGYARAKARLFDLMDGRDTAVLNRRDAWCRKIGRGLRCRKAWFPSPAARRLSSLLRLPGEHNQENGMAAVLAAQAIGLSNGFIARGIRGFRGVQHRIEVVRSIGGVDYVNDSKSTNVDSTTVALKAFNRPLFLILGGQHKGAPYTPLAPLLRRRVKRIYTIGEAAPIIEKDLRGVVPIARLETLDRAVAAARRESRRGDVVLLSPACASFDQFKNFEHRGDTFARLVRRLG